VTPNAGVVNPPPNDHAEYPVAQHLPRDKCIDSDLWMKTGAEGDSSLFIDNCQLTAYSEV
jgi:hypothetical protein